MIEQLAASETVRYIAGIIGGVLRCNTATKRLHGMSVPSWWRQAQVLWHFAPQPFKRISHLGDAYTSGVSFVLGLYG